jgi:coenzyme PQQ precursor peptide PqqA
MATALVPDCLWHVIEPLLPLPKPKPQGGRPRVTDRACLKGILFVLRSAHGSVMLKEKQRLAVYMQWTKPEFEEIPLCCEINSYACAEL